MQQTKYLSIYMVVSARVSYLIDVSVFCIWKQSEQGFFFLLILNVSETQLFIYGIILSSKITFV